MKQKFKGKFFHSVRDYTNRKNSFEKYLYLYVDATWAEVSNGCFYRIIFTKNLRNATFKNKNVCFHVLSKPLNKQKWHLENSNTLTKRTCKNKKHVVLGQPHYLPADDVCTVLLMLKHLANTI